MAPEKIEGQDLDGSTLENLPTIAFLGSSPGGTYNQEKWSMWRGVFEAAQERHINLLYIAGEEIADSPQAALYDLLDEHNIQGIILWSSFFCPRASEDEVRQYLRRYGNIPLVTIELALAEVPCVMVDNLQGIRVILSHLLQEHHYRRIAFVTESTNHTANLRRQAFEYVMREYNAYHPELVGSIADLDRNGCVAGIDYQAIVVHSDTEAVYVMELLRSRGIRVPEDVAVTGFNDGHEARSVIPALTTLRLPFRRMGRLAVETLDATIRGEVAPHTATLQMHLVLRSSCGCFEPLTETAASGFVSHSNSPIDDVLENFRDDLIKELTRSIGGSLDSNTSKWAERLLDLFVQEMLACKNNRYDHTHAREFLESLQILLRQAIDEGSNINRWNQAVSQLRNFFLPYVCDEQQHCLEDRSHQARVMIGQLAVRAEINHNWQSANRDDILRSIVAKLLIAFDSDEFSNIITDGLAQLKIEDLFIVLYEPVEDGQGLARIFLAIQDGQRLAFDGKEPVFASREILPPPFLACGRPYSLLIEALHLGAEQIGYMVIKANPPGDPTASDIYEALRIEISSAIKNIQLRQQLREAVKTAEEANQLKSRFLSMVSHELRTPINLIVGLSEMAKRQQTKGGKKALTILSSYLDQLYVSGQHLDRLIRDVLDLASSQVGQMNIIHQPVDMVLVLSDAAVMGKQLADQKNLDFVLEIEPSLPHVWGDKTRLRQIVLNLLSNAVKFTARGEIRLSAKRQDEHLMIEVSDTGLGIALHDQTSIFDEFHQTSRTMVRGYGGIGLGLAITRRLVEMHGGTIRVESNGAEGSGSRFMITMPVIDSIEMAVPSTIEIHDGQVLILSNQPGESSDLIRYLKKQGFDLKVQPFEPAPVLVEALSTSPPGAVVLDLAPDSETGWSLIKTLKENAATQEIPVLFYKLFAENDSGSVLDVDFMLKPVGADQLVKVLQRYGLKGTPQEEQKVVLVVDDDPGILELHAQLVRAELPEARVVTASNGRHGLEIMQQEQPDLVLLDLMMPELDGFGVIKKMQEDPSLRAIPVIVLTAQVLSKEDMGRLSKGVSSVLAKGMFTRDEIMQRIEIALTQRIGAGGESVKLVRHAMAFIHENYKEMISRSDIAQHLSVNEQYLSRCFKKEIGIGPMAYLGRHRILRAKRLLERGELSVTQVALEVGFTSQSYFSRIFQQETGLTPTAYIRGAHVEKV